MVLWCFLFGRKKTFQFQRFTRCESCLFALFICLGLGWTSFTLTEAAGMFRSDPTPLYGPEDQVYILNATTIKNTIYGSSRAWVVEFFSSWCGHCIHFAPKWKQFGLDLQYWQNTLVIAGLDCADDDNVAICRDYEIMGYPSLRFFPPFSPMNKTKMVGDKEEKDLFRGEAVEKDENIGEMKRSVMNLLVPHLENFHDQDPAKIPVPNSKSVWEYVTKIVKPPKDLPSLAVVVFEAEKSFLGKDIGITLSKFPSVTVFRFTVKNELYSELNLDGWPAAGYVRPNMLSGKFLLGTNQDIAKSLIASVMDIAGLPKEELTSTSNIHQKVLSEVKVMKEEAIANIIEEPTTSTEIVSMEDLIHAVRNALRNEVGLFKKISGDQLQVLKNFIHILSEFFPSDRRELTVFFIKLGAWLGPLQELDDTTYMDKLSELENELHPWDIDVNTWGNCKGTVPGRRGYTCSLWTLFHTLTIIAYDKKQDFPVLDGIHGFVKNFFGCKECSNHFSQMVADDGALMITPMKDQVLWLWKAHNKVNKRLKGTLSEDPGFPKTQFPTDSQCSDCYHKDNVFDESEVLEYLLNMYSKPERTLVHVKPSTDRIYSAGGRMMSNSRFFSGIDYWLFGGVYIMVAALLVFAYIHFRVRSIRFTIPSSSSWFRRVKHQYYVGKSNV